MELDYEPTVADRRVAQGTLQLEANRRPPSLVDVGRAVTAGQGGAAVTAGRRASQWPPPQLLHPARALGVRHISALTCDDASRYPPGTPRLLDPSRDAIAGQHLRTTFLSFFSRGQRAAVRRLC